MPTSQARLLLQKSAAEAGVDERSAVSLMKPAHYPDMMWHSSGRYMTPEEEAAFRVAEAQNKPHAALQFTKRTTGMTFLVRKQRQLLEYFQTSPQHIQHVPPHMDIARYHDIGKNRRNPDRPDRVVREALGKLANKDHLPEELLGTSDSRKKSRKRRRNADGTLIDLDEFEKKERVGADGANEDSDDESDDEDNLEMFEDNLDEEEEEDDNQDYTTNYYESEDESDGGGDGGEPTF